MLPASADRLHRGPPGAGSAFRNCQRPPAPGHDQEEVEWEAEMYIIGGIILLIVIIIVIVLLVR